MFYFEKCICAGDVHNEIIKEIQIEEEVSKFTETSVSKNNVSSQLEDRFNKLEKLYEKSEKSRIALKKNLIAAKKQIKQLQQEKN